MTEEGTEGRWMMEPVCVDASFVLHLVIPSPLTGRVEEMVLGWVEEGRRMVAPRLWAWEVTNALWRMTKRAEGAVPAEAAREGLERLMKLPVEFVDVEERAGEAWEKLLEKYGLASAYDACYLLTAQVCGAKLWTCDRRLAEKAKESGLVEMVEVGDDGRQVGGKQ